MTVALAFTPGREQVATGMYSWPPHIPKAKVRVRVRVTFRVRVTLTVRVRVRVSSP